MSNAVRWAAPELAPPPPPPPQEPVRHMPSVEEVQAIEEAAHAEGYARGHAEGVAAGQAEVRRIAAQMEGILDAFTRPLARLDAEVGDALGDLAVRIAGALLRRDYAAEPALLEALVREALELAGSDQRQLELRLHPDDLAMLAPQLLALEGVRLSGDTTLARGDLRLHADSVRIDGSLSTRLNAVLQRIVSGAGA
ncbi:MULTISPECIES: FliH/SctL family protein [Thermomonas]|jgi:flagellar assembly protein FliH|uniref:Flagellar assembly protein FliH n=1 Tax=Thermomonas fusca TaxID=215690 RepID=A0A5R9PD52_9GAMM|nr:MULTISPECIES: FliH/SctL family protein [Thermomonas]TLX21405.1 flagellar assembly protein FliH [Thermomonas fusca]